MLATYHDNTSITSLDPNPPPALKDAPNPTFIQTLDEPPQFFAIAKKEHFVLLRGAADYGHSLAKMHGLYQRRIGNACRVSVHIKRCI